MLTWTGALISVVLIGAGSLLNAYGNWTFGQIALFAARGAYIAAALMLVLTLHGLRHCPRVVHSE